MSALGTVHVRNYERCLPWYEKLFGRAPDRISEDAGAAWDVDGHGAFHLAERRDATGGSWITLGVKNLDEQKESLEARGLEVGMMQFGESFDRQGLRLASLFDPEGNVITLEEEAAAEPFALGA